MTSNLFHLFCTFLLFIVIQTFLVHCRNLKPAGQSPNSLQLQLEGCHKNQTVKGIRELKKYLERFGYLNYGDYTGNHNHTNDDVFDDQLEAAVKAYQANYHLKVTGNLDSETLQEMMMPRCGVPDIINGTNSKDKGETKHDHRHKKFHMVSHFSFFEGMPKWPPHKTHLTYTFRSTAPVVGLQELRSVCTRAFQRWADVTQFTFEEARQGAQADIEIGFHRGSHGDGFPFDGQGDAFGNTLAHAFRPPIGWFHYDAAENWSTNPSVSQMDLESVAVHEIGHLLGLGHSTVRAAIMYPDFQSGVEKRDLHPNDIEGIRVLYSS